MNSDFNNRPVAVIGLGLMGGSFAERLTELGCFVIGFNRTVETAERALTMGIVQSIDPEDLKKAVIVIFCTPVKGTLAFLREHADWLKAGTVLTDIAGVKDHTWPLIRELLPPGMDFVQAAVYNQVGRFGPLFITVSIFLFAFSSLVGNYYYTEANFRFIRDSRRRLLIFRCTCVAAVFAGALMDFSTVWSLADILMGLMAVVNLTAILLLGNKAFTALKDYQKQRRAGKNPVFRAEEAGVGDPTVWDEAHAHKWEEDAAD